MNDRLLDRWRRSLETVDWTALDSAAAIFKALADPLRLRTLVLLSQGERNVSELAEAEGDKVGTVSARLKVLLTAQLVRRRREGQTIVYSLADNHVLNLISNAVDHAGEDHGDKDAPPPPPEDISMTEHTHSIHTDHPHAHGPSCGHTAVRHGDHVDYLHDSHLHHLHGDHIDEHVVEVSAANPDHCTPENGHKGHEAGHHHGPGCGHEAVPHGNHLDYLVDGRLHHAHGDHCDDHGVLAIV
jgi:DNA-binding transcriptional ArsR family regulator